MVHRPHSLAVDGPSTAFAGRSAGRRGASGCAAVAGVVPGGAEMLPPGVHRVPADIDAEAARLVLAALGADIDSLTPAQRAYLASWHLGS